MKFWVAPTYMYALRGKTASNVLSQKSHLLPLPSPLLPPSSPSTPYPILLFPPPPPTETCRSPVQVQNNDAPAALCVDGHCSKRACLEPTGGGADLPPATALYMPNGDPPTSAPSSPPQAPPTSSSLPSSGTPPTAATPPSPSPSQPIDPGQ